MFQLAMYRELIAEPIGEKRPRPKPIAEATGARLEPPRSGRSRESDKVCRVLRERRDAGSVTVGSVLSSVTSVGDGAVGVARAVGDESLSKSHRAGRVEATASPSV